MPESYEFRRSLRASRARRAAALRKRRTVRSYRSTIAVLAGTAVLATVAAAAGTGSPTGSRGGGVSAAQAALGVNADGVVGPVTRAAVKSFQRKHGLVADGVIGPATLAALGLKAKARSTPATATQASASASSPSSTPLLEAIARCESGGDPTQLSDGGLYRGKYQFLRSTWREVGGTGDPATATESEQDKRAAILMKQAGPGAWPACSAKLGASR